MTSLDTTKLFLFFISLYSLLYIGSFVGSFVGSDVELSTEFSTLFSGLIANNLRSQNDDLTFKINPNFSNFLIQRLIVARLTPNIREKSLFVLSQYPYLS